jgi:hypothetical protein
MNRRALISLLTVLAGGGTACLAQALPNGLELARFEVRASEPAVAGSTVNVEITLKNLSAAPMRFDAGAGIFVGARINSTSDANNRDFGHAHQGLILAPGRETTLRASRLLDAAGTWRFWPAFRLNGQWGPFRWMEKTLEVYSSAAEARSQGGGGAISGTLTVAQLLANPSRYDGKRVTVTGNALIVRQQQDRATGPWTLMSLADIENSRQVMNVIAPGQAPVVNGDVARATGVFRTKNQRGRYAYDNELVCQSGGIVQDQRQSAQKLADDKTDVSSVIDIRKVVGARFNMGLLQNRLAAVGAEVRVQFQTRAYSQTPRRNTVTGTGKGAAGIRVEAAERRHQVAGRTSDMAGPGNTWLIARAWLRGDASNTGLPDTFSQSFVYRDPCPVFFLVGSDGTVYWPDGIWLNPVNYSNRGDKTTGDIRTNSGAWVRTSLPFKVPQTIRQPTLVVLTWQGGTSYQYSGIRLE